MNYCKDCRHSDVIYERAYVCSAKAVTRILEDPVDGPTKTRDGLADCANARAMGGICGPDGTLYEAEMATPTPRRRRSPLRFWRRLVAYREWQDQIVVCQKAGPEYYYLAQEAEQRYKELCK